MKDMFFSCSKNILHLHEMLLRVKFEDYLGYYGIFRVSIFLINSETFRVILCFRKIRKKKRIVYKIRESNGSTTKVIKNSICLPFKIVQVGQY